MSSSSVIFSEHKYTQTPLEIESADVRIGAFCALEGADDAPITLERGVRIGNFVSIKGNSLLGEGVEIRDYGSVGVGSTMGTFSKLLYGGAIYNNVRIGRFCIIGGSVDTGTHIGDNVTFLGRVLHNYRTPGSFADLTDGVAAPSPVIRDRAVVGEGSLIIGGVEIGVGAYVAAGTTVKSDVPPGHLYSEMGLIPLRRFHGFIKARDEFRE